MKKLYLSLLLLIPGLVTLANHITGGDMYYTLTNVSGNKFTYHVVLNLYRDCFAPPRSAPLDEEASIAIFDNTTNHNMIWQNSKVPRSKIVHLNLSSPSPCIQNPPAVCYDVGYYEFDVTLDGIPTGYTITFQRCCRIAGINNVISSSSGGATYTAIIPGTAPISTAPANNSAHFTGTDTVAICAHNPFSYNFGAEDADGDILSYYFCTAYGGGSTDSPVPDPPNAPPYNSVPYAGSYNANAPMGPNISIDPKTGLIKGIAPAPGIYVVTVCVDEIRNGKIIATQRKDLQIKVADCNLTTPQLDPQYITCNGFDLTFFNHNESPLINSYYWTFGDGNSSTEATPTNLYSDTGVYKIKLVVNKGQQCSDSATAIAKVFPGFFPGFVYNGVCFNHPTQFTDTTRTVYGTVNSWQWDFGDPSNNNNFSQQQNPSHTYPQKGKMTVEFIVSSSKGCSDTVVKTIEIIDKPPLRAIPKDTLICNGDAVVLGASGSGNFSWSPGTNIINANTSSPTVNPTVSTKYFVQLEQDGCTNRDTVSVRVVDFVSLKVMGDTTICATDPVQLKVATDALHFNWTPAATLNDPTLKSPIATPTGLTTYHLTASIGHCTATDQVTVRIVPYPGSNAGADTIICYNGTAQLHGSIKGSSYSWFPGSSLSDPASLNPFAKPLNTTNYILIVFDTLGCPKPGLDTVLVTVIPKVNAFAGFDTAVVVGQPLQLNASGGVGYLWSPPNYLNNNTINNPVAIFDETLDSIQYKLRVNDENGCLDSTYLTIKIFKTAPWIFVPKAFTPNGDGKNDVFRPIAVGISRIDYFSVYNRWGELVFTTTTNKKGWDGTISGKQQGSGTFVWMAKGVDYTGKIVFAKGTVTLIR